MDLLYYDNHHGLIICKQCKIVIVIDDKCRVRTDHFLTKHSTTKLERKQLQKAISSLDPPSFTAVKEKLHLENPVQPILYLPILEGFTCLTCKNWLCTDQDAACKHAKIVHGQQCGSYSDAF